MSILSREKTRRQSIRIVAVYAIVGSAWIYLSDSALGMFFRDPSVLARIGMYKGLMFIVLTSLLLYFLISRYAAQMAEAACRIQKSEDRFNSIYNNLTDAIFIHDPVTAAILDANQAAATMFGYTKEELLSKSAEALSQGSPPYSRAEALGYIRRTAGGSPQLFEWMSRKSDGALFWTEINMRLARIGDDEQVIVVARDISERKRAEESLRLSEEKFANIFRLTPDSMTITGPDRKYVDVNQGFCDLTGFAAADVIGKSPEELLIWVEPAERQRLLDETAREGMVLNREARFRRRDGSIFVGQVSARPIEVVGRRCILAITRDITVNKEAEDLLRRQQQELRALVDIMPVCISWADDSGNIEYLNNCFVESFGYTLSDVPTVDAWFRHAYPDASYRKLAAARWKADLDWAKKNNTAVPPRDAVITCKDGSTRHVIINMHLALNRTLAILTDVTEREHVRSELVKKQKLESLGVLAGGIAHDFNNILTGILANISFALMVIEPGHRAFVPLSEAEKATGRASALARQLVTFAKGGNPVTEVVPCRQLIEESVSLMSSGSNVRVLIDVADSVPPIGGDPGQLSQVFNNLMLNAIQAMPDGGTVWIRAEGVEESRADSSAPARYVKISFMDDGCGITEEDQRRIFDPYFTTKSDGTGLGLASVHSIVSRHGGQIAVKSAVGEGATFTITLPAAAREAGNVEKEDHADTAPTGECSVLVMDDEPLILSVAEQLLPALGYQVATCCSGDEAIAMYCAAREKGKPFAAAIMDLTIRGGMGGREAARRILAVDPDAYLIVSSGYSEDPVVADYAAFGFRGAVSKPYRAQDLAKVLSRVPLPVQQL